MAASLEHIYDALLYGHEENKRDMDFISLVGVRVRLCVHAHVCACARVRRRATHAAHVQESLTRSFLVAHTYEQTCGSLLLPPTQDGTLFDGKETEDLFFHPDVRATFCMPAVSLVLYNCLLAGSFSLACPVYPVCLPCLLAVSLVLHDCLLAGSLSLACPVYPVCLSYACCPSCCLLAVCP
eukprot:scaffold70234_cov22-Tisochrysis_lutea.AAC.2